MRALLVINPRSSGASAATQRVVVSALKSEIDLTVVETDSRGHGVVLSASHQDFDLVIACGGDGTVNEVCNGIVDFQTGRSRGPALGIIPTGSTNVFARALGLKNDPVEAANQLLEAITQESKSSISLGVAIWQSEEQLHERVFTFCAGLGFDAAIVERVDQERKHHGNRSSSTLYWRANLREISRTILTEEHSSLRYIEEDISLGIALISNTDPYTYKGNRGIHPTPRANFTGGLDMMALHNIRLPLLLSATAILALGQTPRGKGIMHRHNLAQVSLRGRRVLPLQLDGEPIGYTQEVTFRSLPQAVTVYGHAGN